MHADRAVAEWADLKAHMVKRFANVHMSKIWEALAPEMEHARWVNVWRVLALLLTCFLLRLLLSGPYHCVAGSPLVCRILWTHVSLACAWHCVPTFPLYSNEQRNKVWQSRHLAARAWFDVRPWHKVSRQLDTLEICGSDHASMPARQHSGG